MEFDVQGTSTNYYNDYFRNKAKDIFRMPL